MAYGSSARGETFGEVSLMMALDRVVFPCSKDELITCHGDTQILWTNKKLRSLRELLRQVPQDHFESMGQLVDAMKVVKQ